jgi:hypothetical protein
MRNTALTGRTSSIPCCMWGRPAENMKQNEHVKGAKRCVKDRIRTCAPEGIRFTNLAGERVNHSTTLTDCQNLLSKHLYSAYIHILDHLHSVEAAQLT